MTFSRTEKYVSAFAQVGQRVYLQQIKKAVVVEQYTRFLVSITEVIGKLAHHTGAVQETKVSKASGTSKSVFAASAQLTAAP